VRADFVNEVAKILKIKRKDMIEKDLILHQNYSTSQVTGFSLQTSSSKEVLAL
jgi:hypothetical protein